MKSIYRYITQSTAMIALLLFALVFIQTPNGASAASPGCYNFNTSSGTYTAVSCNDADLSKQVSQSSRCFMSTTSGSTTTGFSSVNCASINSSQSGTPSTTTTPTTAAASPGCYNFNTSSGTYTAVSCNDADLSKQVSQSSRCFLSTTSGSSTTGFSNVACSSIRILQATPSPSTTPGATTPGTTTPGTTTPGTTAPEENNVTLVEPLVPAITQGDHVCGSGERVVQVAFDFGCRGTSYNGELNPIVDIAFAIFRALSAGVGMVIIGSIIIAGLQYSSSAGNPQATQAAIKRITNSITALLLFIFMFAITNFLVPGGLFN